MRNRKRLWKEDEAVMSASSGGEKEDAEVNGVDVDKLES